MRKSLFILFLLTLSISYLLKFQANASPAGPLIKHLSSLLKWTRSSPKAPQTDGSVLQYENGYLVETVVEGNDLGVVPHSIRVSQDGELFAVDAVNNNIVRITPPLSQYSRARLVAGSFQGYSGHVDGKPSDARFNHPKGVTMDDKGNVYVADTSNLAIRKIGDSGVTTIAGGKSNVAGYRDGPSEDAKFSTDFDVVYIGHTCSLLVVDRGNAALRQISLNQEDCDHQDGSISTADIIMVVGAVLVGYASGMLQQGFGSSFFSRTKMQQQSIESEIQDQPKTEKPTIIVESIKEEPDAGWPSFGRLIIDLSKLAVEALGSALLYFIPLGIKTGRPKKGLTPLKDSLVMPEDKAEPPLMQRHRTAIRLPETRHAHTHNASDGYTQPRPALAPNASDGYTQPRPAHSPNASDGYTQPRAAHTPNASDGYTQPRPAHSPNASDGYTQLRPAHTPNAGDGYTQPKPHRSKSASSKDPSLPSRQRSSKRQEFGEFYGSGETPPPYSQVSSKSQKERSRHRHRDRNPEVVFGAAGAEPKPVEIKPVDYSDPKFDQYNIRSKYGSSSSFRF